MRIHHYYWRGVILECPCGRDFHVAEQNLASFCCPCGKAGCMGPRRAYQAIEAMMPNPAGGSSRPDPAFAPRDAKARAQRRRGGAMGLGRRVLGWGA